MSTVEQICRISRSKQEAKAAYDRISRWYDILEGIWEKKSRDAGLRTLRVGEGECVLEIGFGTGHALLALARSVGESGKVYGVDLSRKMLDITRARVRKEGCSERTSLTRGDAAHLPFQGESLNAIFMSFTLELFDTPEIPEVLFECKRVLQRGGRICVVSLSREGRTTWIRNLYEWGHGKIPRLLDCRPIYVRRALEIAGFHILDTSWISSGGLPVEIILAGKPDERNIFSAYHIFRAR